MFKLKLVTSFFGSQVQIPTVQIIKNARIRSVGSFRRPQLIGAHIEQLAVLRDKLQRQVHPLSATKWKALREEFLNSSKHIKEVNVDATILGLCDVETQLRVAKSYIDFLESEGMVPNYATIGRVLRMYYPAYRNGQLTKDDEDDILKIYRALRQKHEILDQVTCENLISALVTTPEWRESLELLDMIRLTCQPSINAYSSIITKSFESSNDMELGWKLLQEICDMGKQPKCEVFIQYLNTIKADQATFKLNLDKILEFIGDNNIIVSHYVINELRKIAQSFNMQSNITKLSKVGQCVNCGGQLSKVAISTKEFLQLSSSFLEKVLIRKDVFLKSSPEEVDRLVRFVDKTAPYDCVIDGLNVAFSNGLRRPSLVYAKTLASVVRYFNEKKKHILVLGRQHMNKWPKEQMTYIKQKSSLFLTNDLSQDDPFLLYAALKSGPRADFVSRDLMRSHAYLLGPELKQVFRRWQQEHQYMLITASDNGNVIIKGPIKYNLSAHKTSSSWHIPFQEEYSTMRSESFELPKSWLCLLTDVI